MATFRPSVSLSISTVFIPNHLCRVLGSTSAIQIGGICSRPSLSLTNKEDETAVHGYHAMVILTVHMHKVLDQGDCVCRAFSVY